LTFVDTNVFMYAVGGRHPLRGQAQAWFKEVAADDTSRLITSAEVLQELLHAYLPVGRMVDLDAALTLAEETVAEVWSVEAEDVRLARALADTRPGLTARDLVHLACCQRRGVRTIKTFDRGLAAALPSVTGPGAAEV